MPREPRPPVPTWAAAWISSFRLSLRSDRKSPRTVSWAVGGASWLAGWLGREQPQLTDWAQVDAVQIREFFVYLQDPPEPGGPARCTQSAANSIGRAVQSWWKWWAAEEDAPNPMDKVRPPSAPKLGATAPAILAVEQVRTLLRDAEAGKDFEGRRDAALIRVFASTGGRVSELALLDLDDVDLENRTIKVLGKGGWERLAPIDHACARAIDRYLRLRARHKLAHLPALWLPIKARPGSRGLTAWGVRQILERRAARLGIKLWPHLFRHTFVDRWLDAGGAEGDLQTIMGWQSPQMLRHYAARSRGKRALRAYDRIDVMGGI